MTTEQITTSPPFYFQSALLDYYFDVGIAIDELQRMLTRRGDIEVRLCNGLVTVWDHLQEREVFRVGIRDIELTAANWHDVKRGLEKA